MNCVTKIRNNYELIFIFAAESAKWQGNESILGFRLSALSPVGPFLCGAARVGAASLFVRLEECGPPRGPLVLPPVVLRCFGPPRHASLAPRASPQGDQGKPRLVPPLSDKTNNASPRPRQCISLLVPPLSDKRNYTPTRSPLPENRRDAKQRVGVISILNSYRLLICCEKFLERAYYCLSLFFLIS